MKGASQGRVRWKIRMYQVEIIAMIAMQLVGTASQAPILSMSPHPPLAHEDGHAVASSIMLVEGRRRTYGMAHELAAREGARSWIRCWESVPQPTGAVTDEKVAQLWNRCWGLLSQLADAVPDDLVDREDAQLWVRC